MPIEAGQKLGPYEIIEPIGKGGMGEVYRARDTKLDRDVAIKVLPEEFANDDERLARFEREAKLLASLNHPNIASIYGFESGALVLELVEGPTLAERIKQGPIPIDEAIAIAKQVAGALEAGHEAGVIHRDLKPANIKVKEDGTVKVLDYGLAKALEGEASPGSADSELSHSPTLTRQGTQIGVILGTAAYMSPEQAKGKRVDKRTDIWAFGAVLYEMLTSQRAFGGEDVSDTLASVLRADINWAKLPEHTPASVRRVLRRSLARDVKERLHDIADARIDLLADDPTSETRSSASKSWFFPVGLIGALIGLAVAALVLRGDTPKTNDTQRFVITPPSSEPPLQLANPAVSPDGRRIVYIGIQEDERRLYLRELAELGSRSLEGTDGAYSPFFSPDGLWVGFFAGGKLKKVSILGGVPIDICDVYAEGPGGSWTHGDTIWFSGNWISGFFEVSADGGEPVPVTTPDRQRGEIGHWWPDFLPDGKTAIFTVFTDEGSHRIAALDLSTGTWEHLFPGMQARYVSSGHIVFYRSGIYQVVAFDPSGGEARGSPIPALETTRGISPTGDVDRHFDVSDTGTLVIVPGGASHPKSVLTWLALDGSVETVPFDSAAIRDFRLDPSGRRAAVTRIDGGIYNIWIYDLERGTEEKITRESNNFQPQWMQDGRRIVFTTARRGQYDILAKPSDALGAEEPVVTRDIDESSGAISRDDRWLAISEFRVGTSEDIAVLDLQNGSKPVPAAKTPFEETSPHFSRDSAWIAYHSNASGRQEIYVQLVTDATTRVKVSSNGGSFPLWSPVDDELYYVLGDEIMAVGYRVVGAEFRAGTPRALVELPEGHLTSVWALDVSPDGKRFLLAVDTGEDPSSTELHVTTNWYEELERLVPTQD